MNARHPDQAHLIAFARGALPSDEAEHVFAHVASCDSCHDRTIALRRLAESPDSAIELVQLVNPDAMQLAATFRHHADRAMAALVGATRSLRLEVRPLGIGIADADAADADVTDAPVEATIDESGSARARVQLDPERRSVAVRVYPIDSETWAVSLIPSNPSLAPITVTAEPQPGTTYHLAEFESVDDVSFQLILSPVTNVR